MKQLNFIGFRGDWSWCCVLFINPINIRVRLITAVPGTCYLVSVQSKKHNIFLRLRHTSISWWEDLLQNRETPVKKSSLISRG